MPESEPSTMGARIRAAREAAGLTQSGLADAAGVRIPTMWRYEKGAKPSAAILDRIAKACRVPLQWLVTGEGEGPAPIPPKSTEAAA